MIHNKWSDTKPEFTEECILITAQNYKPGWEYRIHMIREASFEDGVYSMAWLTGEGEEYGDLLDLKAEKYYTMPLLK